MLVAAPSEIRETGELVSRSSLARSASDEVLPDWHLGRPGRKPGRLSMSAKGERLFFNRSPSRVASAARVRAAPAIILGQPEFVERSRQICAGGMSGAGAKSV